MIKENKGKEKTCLFFVSDYHFEMISLPYISKNLDKGKKIIMLSENNLEDSIQKVLSSTNLANEQKDKIKNINWKNNNIDKINKLNKIENDTIIFVKGNETFINNTNNNLNSIDEFKNVEIIDCYDINEVEENISNIVNKYNKILSTSGVERILS